MKRNFSLKRGFTLIEILIVVAIIGILTSILVANYNEARKNARDKIRKSELKELQLAIELYKAQNGMYPESGCGAAPGLWVGPGVLPGWGFTCDEYIKDLVPNFIAALPRDPKSELEPQKGYIYTTEASRTSYKVIVYDSVESQIILSKDDEFSRYPSKCTSAGVQPYGYSVYSAGAECW